MARSVTGVVAAASVAVLAAGVLAPVSAQAVAGAELSVPVVSADSTPQVRGDIAAGVPVSQVKVLRNGKKITAKIRWNQGLINRKGNSDRFNVRLVAFPTGDGAPIVLTNRSKTKTPPPVQKIRIKLSTNKAKKLRAADDAVLTVSQQHGKTKSKRFNRAYVTVTKLTATNGRALSTRSLATDTRAGRDCMTRLIRPGANLAGCDLAAASLRDCALSRTNLTGADLSAALLRGCVVKKTKLAGSDLSGADASGLSGTPASLPAGWTLVNGKLVPPNPTPPAPSAQTITFPGLADTELNATPPTPGATASSGSAVTYTSSTTPVCTTTGPGVITFVSVGTCTINADQAGDATFAPAPQVQQSFDVTTNAQTIAFTGPGDVELSASPVTVSATATSTLAVVFTSDTTAVCTVSGDEVSLLTAGTCTINADQAGDATWAAAPQVPQSFEVTKDAQTISFTGPADTALSASPVTVSATATSSLTVLFTSATVPVCTVSGTTVNLLTEGMCTINADQAGDATWAAAPQVPQSFEVTAAVVSCSDGGGAAGTCVVGGTGPGGGKVFYVNDGAADGSRYMEAVVAGMTPAWDDTNGGDYYPWCVGIGQTDNVTTGTTIGAGKTNTDNMVAVCTSGAANSVRAYTGGGLAAGSWSLPSKAELNKLDVSGVGGLTGAGGSYWSSSQVDALYAWGQLVGAGGGSTWQSTGLKGLTSRVRPVRAF